MTIKTFAAALALTTATAAPALAHDHDHDAMETGTIVDVAVGNDSFETLVAAVQAAGLVDALSGDGPFTVFAPTDDAFGKLPAGTVETLVKPENKDTLTEILTYHVVPGNYTAADVVSALQANGGVASFKTLAPNASITAALYDGKVYLSDYKGQTIGVIATDVMASNGTIHVLDTVLLP